MLNFGAWQREAGICKVWVAKARGGGARAHSRKGGAREPRHGRRGKHGAGERGRIPARVAHANPATGERESKGEENPDTSTLPNETKTILPPKPNGRTKRGRSPDSANEGTRGTAHANARTDGRTGGTRSGANRAGRTEHGAGDGTRGNERARAGRGRGSGRAPTPRDHGGTGDQATPILQV